MSFEDEHGISERNKAELKALSGRHYSMGHIDRMLKNGSAKDKKKSVAKKMGDLHKSDKQMLKKLGAYKGSMVREGNTIFYGKMEPKSND